MKEGDIIEFDIYGKIRKCKVLVVRPAGTVDVEVLDTGKCFRVSGLTAKGK